MSGYNVVALSGPSGVGKTPLIAAIAKFFPEIQLYLVPVIKSEGSRPDGPRPDEKALFEDIRYFRSAEEIIGLAWDPRYLVHKEGDNGGNPHAIDLDEIMKPGLVVVETCPTLVSRLKEIKWLNVTSVFLSPLSFREIKNLYVQGVDLEVYVSRLIEETLRQRTAYYGRDPQEPVTNYDISSRAKSAYYDLMHAPMYDHVLVNRDGEGRPNWRREPYGRFTGRPMGDALKTMEAFAHILLALTAQVSERQSLAPALR